MKAKVMTPLARLRARRRELRKEMARVAESFVREARLVLAVLDEPMPGADQGVVLEGRVEDGKIVVD